jgi:hypothetical protein
VVAPDRWDDAVELLRAIGFRPGGDHPGDAMRDLARAGHGVAFVGLPGFVIDLHANLGGGPFPEALPFDAVWSRRASVALDDGDVATPGAVDLALYLAPHGSKHCWCRLAWVNDFALAIAQSRIGDGPAAPSRELFRHVVPPDRLPLPRVRHRARSAVQLSSPSPPRASPGPWIV